MMPTREEWYSALESRHGKELQKKLSSSCVAVCGLGGLGSNIAIALARCGVGKLILIDFDKVDITNLHRQQYKACQIGSYKTDALRENLEEIAPFVSITAKNVRVTEANVPLLLTDADIICEAFDDADEKAMLTDAVLTSFKNKYFIASSGMAGTGSQNKIKTRRVTDYFYLCGDEESDVNDGIGLVASRVMLCAAHEAHMCIRIIAGETDNL